MFITSLAFLMKALLWKPLQ